MTFLLNVFFLFVTTVEVGESPKKRKKRGPGRRDKDPWKQGREQARREKDLWKQNIQNADDQEEPLPQETSATIGEVVSSRARHDTDVSTESPRRNDGGQVEQRTPQNSDHTRLAGPSSSNYLNREDQPQQEKGNAQRIRQLSQDVTEQSRRIAKLEKSCDEVTMHAIMLTTGLGILAAVFSFLYKLCSGSSMQEEDTSYQLGAKRKRHTDNFPPYIMPSGPFAHLSTKRNVDNKGEAGEDVNDQRLSESLNRQRSYSV